MFRDQVSHPYRTTGKIIVLFSLCMVYLMILSVAESIQYSVERWDDSEYEFEGIWKEVASYNVFNSIRWFVICEHKSPQFKNVF
jgi:hypothetical protein